MISTTAATERETALFAKRQEAIRLTLGVLQSELDLRDYEAEQLRYALNRPNFYEFWFSGRGSSLKVYLNNSGVPFVHDQHNARALLSVVRDVNAKLAALFA